MRRRALVVIGAVAAGAATSLFAACFPDYEVGSGDGGTGADGSTMTDGPATTDSTTTPDSGDGATGQGDGGVDSTTSDGSPPSEAAAVDSSTFVDTGLPSLDGSLYDGAVPTGMTLFQPGAFHFTVYSADSNGPTDAAVNATATLDYAFAIDDTEVTAAAFQGWLDAGLPTPASSAPLDPGGPYATLMVWNDLWTTSWVHDAGAYEGPGCDNTGGVAATLPRGVADYPVSCVNWFQALAYCAWKGKRLPTDTEWRVAATAGGAHQPYPWGTTDPTTCAFVTGNVGSGTNCGFPLVVGSATSGATATTPPMFDLVGSLDEWMWDFIDPNGSTYTYPAAAKNYAGPAQTSQSDDERQYFGGCYYDNGIQLQNWQPGATSAGGDQGYDNTGFRCAKTL